ncbi:RNA polymerase sigma factor [Nannocystis punicea]|uniref:Sigma-70 family RNA polymerase sigma factor n=1 Tax=Nannocystis punicea TaxID=2995304 RepID=A0ABY7H8D1_9BACT|nr:sigma-70 family RNA polymerase sigma factor [Nannocystis poenicansa]WAS95526.1 sigma-70 family RNA polymerase sigma factor [Nannocystis poenicansa]
MTAPPAAAPRPASAARPPDGLAEVYREHHDFMWRSLRRLGVDEADVEDAVHDAFLVVARRLADFEGRSSLRTWLFAIAMRVAQSRRRDHQREVHHLRRYELSVAPRSPADPQTRHETAVTLHQLLAGLDDDQRAVFIMIELENMTAPEIAAALDLKLPTVYSRLRLARQAMQRAVARYLARTKEKPR